MLTAAFWPSSPARQRVARSGTRRSTANEPSPLVTFTMTGAADSRSSGKNACVIRTIPTMFVSTPRAARAVELVDGVGGRRRCRRC